MGEYRASVAGVAHYANTGTGEKFAGFFRKFKLWENDTGESQEGKEKITKGVHENSKI